MFSDNIGTVCVTCSNCGKGAAPTRKVGESGARKFRMGRFQRLQFDKQLVVLGVGNGGIVEHVVGVQMPIKFGSECQDAPGGVLVGQISHYCGILQLNKRRARVEPAGMSAASISW